MTRKEIIVSGYGGQGVITLGRLLAHSAVHFLKKAATQTSAYGVASRGGACWTAVVISEEEFDYPEALNPDYSFILSQEAAFKYGKFIKDSGVVIYDSSVVGDLPTKGGVIVYGVQATKISVDELDSPLYANIIMLGFFSALTEMLSRKDAEELIKANMPKQTIDDNLKAFERGYNLKNTIEARIV